MNSHLTNDVIQILHLMNIKGFHLEIKPLNDDHTKENIYSNIIVTKDSEIVDVNQEAFMNAYSELWLEKLRTQRNKRLADADWVVIRATSTDTPVPEEWKAFDKPSATFPRILKIPRTPCGQCVQMRWSPSRKRPSRRPQQRRPQRRRRPSRRPQQRRHPSRKRPSRRPQQRRPQRRRRPLNKSNSYKLSPTL